MGGEKIHIRASKRAAGPKTDGRAMDVEIEAAKKLLRDLSLGMRNLREMRPVPWDIDGRILKQAAKIRAVEARLFRLRQGRLL